ncbi:MAG TPA: ABC-2 family transporter protein [Thermomicrobiales bacterium]|nr:ABC-2 family transporter protein [Thermomicrobiales bacterium]
MRRSLPSWRLLRDYYRRQFAINLSLNLAYRGAAAIWVLSSIMQPLVSLVVWRTVAGPDGEAGGFTANQYTAYFIMVLIVSNLTFIWHMWEFEWRIRTGAFSPLLLRPIHPIHNDISENLSFKTIGLVGVVPAAIVIGIVFHADFGGTTPGHIVAFIPALLFAMALRFILEWTLALAAFWLTKVSALNDLFDVFFLFLGGQFAPLDVMPGWIQTLAFLSPFPWSIAFPVEVALGQRSGSDILIGYGAQLAWIAVASAVLALVWRHAVSKYSAVGS